MAASTTEGELSLIGSDHCVAMHCGYALWLCTVAIQDPLVNRATVEHYRCRSAYKLIELDDKYHFLCRGAVVVRH